MRPGDYLAVVSSSGSGSEPYTRFNGSSQVSTSRPATHLYGITCARATIEADLGSSAWAASTAPAGHPCRPDSYCHDDIRQQPRAIMGRERIRKISSGTTLQRSCICRAESLPSMAWRCRGIPPSKRTPPETALSDKS